MKTSHGRLLGVIAFGLLSMVTVPTRGADGPYHFVKEIPVGGEGGWDYLSVDEADRRLYVSHQTRVVVIDLDKESVVWQILDTPGVHGLAVASDLQRGFSSNGQENKAGIVDLKTLQTLSKVDTGPNPDGMLYEPGRQEVYFFNGRGQIRSPGGGSDGRRAGSRQDRAGQFQGAGVRDGQMTPGAGGAAHYGEFRSEDLRVVNPWTRTALTCQRGFRGHYVCP
jgi:hypothetical protein